MSKFITQEDANWVQYHFPPGPKKLESFLMSWAEGKYVMDVIKLDDYAHERLGYTEEKHGSLKDFFEKVHFKDTPENCHTLWRLLGIEEEKENESTVN